MTTRSTDRTAWPVVDIADWAPTKRSLHLYVQMLGKMRLSLSPSQSTWMFTALTLNARGVTTGAMAWHDTAVEASLDVFSCELIVARSTGATRRIPLLPVRTVAEVYATLQRTLDELDFACTISPIPQEVPDTTPLHDDNRTAAYDPQAVHAGSQP